MSNQKVNRAVREAVSSAMFWDVGGAVRDAVRWDVREAVGKAMNWAVDRAVAEAEERAVNVAVGQDPEHFALQDFPRSLGVGMRVLQERPKNLFLSLPAR
jgi:hypothetical protein